MRPDRQENGCVWVLIDTYWNVNVCKSLGVHMDEIVLIDTYWNVNIFI